MERLKQRYLLFEARVIELDHEIERLVWLAVYRSNIIQALQKEIRELRSELKELFKKS